MKSSRGISASFFSKGGLYKVHNSNLLYHGCVPMDEQGNFKTLEIDGKAYGGKALYDVLEHYARKGFYNQAQCFRKAPGPGT